jgi:geranylgeranylglycerol-phosphate geranylgeranyltransferase
MIKLNKAKGFIEIARPHVAIQAAAYAFLGAYLSGGVSYLASFRVILSAIVIALGVAFAFIVNDYCDVNVDKLNKPNHPIPSGRVSKNAAYRLSILIALLALIVSLLLGPLLLFITMLLLIVSASYSIFLKKTPMFGNITIAFLNATIVLIGGMVARGITRPVCIVSVLGFLYTCAQEVLYTVRDLDADKAMGLRTTAVYFGKETTIKIYRFFASMYIIAVIVPWAINYATIYYLAAIIPLAILPTIVNLVLTFNHTNKTLALACRVTRLARLGSLIAMILLK